MMSADTIINNLNYLNLKEVSQATGLHYMTLYNIKKGKSKPSYATVKKLSEFLEGLING